MRKFWPLLFGIVMAGAFILTAISPWMGWWIPRNVASYGGEVDMLFYVILGVTAFFFVLTEAILVVNMFKYEAEPGRKRNSCTATIGWKWFGRSFPACCFSSWPSCRFTSGRTSSTPRTYSSNSTPVRARITCKWKSRRANGISRPLSEPRAV